MQLLLLDAESLIMLEKLLMQLLNKVDQGTELGQE